MTLSAEMTVDSSSWHRKRCVRVCVCMRLRRRVYVCDNRARQNKINQTRNNHGCRLQPGLPSLSLSNPPSPPTIIIIPPPSLPINLPSSLTARASEPCTYLPTHVPKHVRTYARTCAFDFLHELVPSFCLPLPAPPPQLPPFARTKISLAVRLLFLPPLTALAR